MKAAILAIAFAAACLNAPRVYATELPAASTKAEATDNKRVVDEQANSLPNVEAPPNAQEKFWPSKTERMTEEETEVHS